MSSPRQPKIWSAFALLCCQNDTTPFIKFTASTRGTLTEPSVMPTPVVRMMFRMLAGVILVPPVISCDRSCASASRPLIMGAAMLVPLSVAMPLFRYAEVILEPGAAISVIVEDRWLKYENVLALSSVDATAQAFAVAARLCTPGALKLV